MKGTRCLRILAAVLAVSILLPVMVYSQEAEEVECFESREGKTIVYTEMIAPGWPNVKCSPKTGGVLWWGDPFFDTEPMGDMPIEADYSREEAVVRPREDKLAWWMPCTGCHDGVTVPTPKDNNPRVLSDAFPHFDVVEDPANLQHGRGAIWCLDCHSRTNRDKLIDHRGNEISFNQPQKLCGKCHGQIYRDWRDGIHGKRIGMWVPGGKKRWWVCSECHNPHDIQQGTRNRGFAQIVPEAPPEIPRGMVNADHEKEHGHGAAHASPTDEAAH